MDVPWANLLDNWIDEFADKDVGISKIIGKRFFPKLFDLMDQLRQRLAVEASFEHFFGGDFESTNFINAEIDAIGFGIASLFQGRRVGVGYSRFRVVQWRSNSGTKAFWL